MREVLEDAVPQDDLAFIHWGRHFATNDYVHCRGVVIAGPHTYPDHIYETYARIAAGWGPEVEVSRETLRLVRRGEHAHHLLQAVCRARVRKIDGEEALAGEVFVIAPETQVNAGVLEQTFPGCVVEPAWDEHELEGRVAEAVRIILEWLRMRPREPLAFADVYRRMGISKQAFAKNVRKHPAFRQELEHLGVGEWPAETSRKTHFVSYPEPLRPFPPIEQGAGEPGFGHGSRSESGPSEDDEVEGSPAS
ncbi:MAG: hypothetical protein ACLFTG_14350 [Alphaproteobacteria bacterium]